MNPATQHRMRLGARSVDYRVVRSNAARKLRVRVGPNGIDVVLPSSRDSEDVIGFLRGNAAWVLNQLQRVERLRRVRRKQYRRTGEILFRGEPRAVRVEATANPARRSMVCLIDSEIVVRQGVRSQTPPARSLETWLRRQAREEIHKHLAIVTARIGQRAHRVFVMGQRTKWGNCSARRNLSFNWRLILAPDFVLRYLVTHEAVHLAIPDHSARFWLTVQSLCRESERAKQWLCSRGSDLSISLDAACSGEARRGK